ncbi:hypothetical protein JCM10003_166 [Bacteroides pyogenes JCM 10003]|nr:hypothetical protein JCM10003_166 [Bacteroides pyogenes JCM 10003]
MVQSGRHSGYFHCKITAISSCRTEAGALNASVRKLCRRFVKRRITVSKGTNYFLPKCKSLFIKRQITVSGVCSQNRNRSNIASAEIGKLHSQARRRIAYHYNKNSKYLAAMSYAD